MSHCLFYIPTSAYTGTEWIDSWTKLKDKIVLHKEKYIIPKWMSKEKEGKCIFVEHPWTKFFILDSNFHVPLKDTNNKN